MLYCTCNGSTASVGPNLLLTDAGSNCTVKSKVSPQGRSLILVPRLTENPVLVRRVCGAVKDSEESPILVSTIRLVTVNPDTIQPKSR